MGGIHYVEHADNEELIKWIENNGPLINVLYFEKDKVFFIVYEWIRE